MRIHEDMEYQNCIVALAEGNERAEVLLVAATEYDHYGAGVLFFSLDSRETYGQAIWDKFEACGNDMATFFKEVLYGKLCGV